MRYGPHDEFWVVTDPTPLSELGDILFKASLEGLMLQFRGGLTIADNPTIFTEPHEAQREAKARLAKRDADDDDFDAEAYDAHKMAKCGGPAECRWCDSLPDTREEW